MICSSRKTKKTSSRGLRENMESPPENCLWVKGETKQEKTVEHARTDTRDQETSTSTAGILLKTCTHECLSTTTTHMRTPHTRVHTLRMFQSVIYIITYTPWRICVCRNYTEVVSRSPRLCDKGGDVKSRFAYMPYTEKQRLCCFFPTITIHDDWAGAIVMQLSNPIKRHTTGQPSSLLNLRSRTFYSSNSCTHRKFGCSRRNGQQNFSRFLRGKGVAGPLKEIKNLANRRVPLHIHSTV